MGALGRNEPAYLALHRSGELQARARQAIACLAQCRFCPRICAVNRLAGETGICKTGRLARVSSSFAHMGEEECLRGWRGSGTIFFARCSLRCVFCQNFAISQGGMGTELAPHRLAQLMLEMQDLGCHNLNLVTPEHVVPQILEALDIAADRGLALPIVYNTSAYDSMASLRLLDGVVDIYMPDFKFWDPHLAQRYLKAKDYPEVARRAIREMHRQVGALVVDRDGLAQRGVLLRHLIMPGCIEDSKAIMRFVAKELSTHTYVNLMDQYYPAGKVDVTRYAALNRCITRDEYEEVLAYARRVGLRRFDTRHAGYHWTQ